MSQIVVTVADYRQAFPEFSDEEQYSDVYLERFLTQAQSYISTYNFRIRPEVRLLAIQYMAGHLMTLWGAQSQNNGGLGDNTAGSVITSAHIDSVSVSMQAPIANNAFAQWIQTTPYGKAYWALLTANNPVGVYWCGNPRVFGIR